MIELRACVTDDDYEAWLGVRRAVLPGERAPSLDELKTLIKPEDARPLAELDGELAGSGRMKRSVRVGASRRACCPRGAGRGVGLLTRLAGAPSARLRGCRRLHVAGADEAFDRLRPSASASRGGRDVEAGARLDGRPAPPRADGVEFVSIECRRPSLRAAWPLARAGTRTSDAQMGSSMSRSRWLAEEGRRPGGSFVALGDEIVGYAGLMRWPGRTDELEHGLTVVRRDWRGRGVAAALKEREIAWAAPNGIRQLVTWTQTGNENMQAVNTRLGYVTTEIDIAFERELPLDA